MSPILFEEKSLAFSIAVLAQFKSASDFRSWLSKLVTSFEILAPKGFSSLCFASILEEKALRHRLNNNNNN